MSTQASGAEEILIIKATEKDADLLLDISAQTFNQSLGSQRSGDTVSAYMSSAFSKEQLLDEIKDASSLFFMAYLAGSQKPVGYTKLRKGKSPKELQNIRAIEIHRIYVLEEMTGKKIGKALIERCLEIARHENYEVIWLGVGEQNHRAINFYKKWGFEKFGSHQFRLGTDEQKDYLMKKDLL
jgi:ribosomal protein S18 acetylase RimI-like enzyme